MQSRANRNPKEKGMTLIFGTLSMLFIIPMIGLAIDVGFLYSVKSKLQASVDGAALAAARGLSSGALASDQVTSAQNSACNWFHSNFPNGYFGTTGTTIDCTHNVVVAQDTNNSNLQDVTVTASTQVDTFFMKWLNFGTTTVTATGTASRRDVVVMMVLDVSSSMTTNDSNGTPACTDMINAAKLFVGKFANGRDHIGMVEFEQSAWVDQSPTTNFRSKLGYYVSATDSASGLIDNVVCNGNTNTSEGLTLGYDQLYKTNLPGALNVIMFFTDGIPNSTTVNFNNNQLFYSTSGCKDSKGNTMSSGKANFASNPPTWTSGATLNFETSLPAGPIAVIRSWDAPNGGTYGLNNYLGYYTGSTLTRNDAVLPATGTYSAPGCSFSVNNDDTKWVNDIKALPALDAFGNSIINDSYNVVSKDSNGNVALNNVQNPGSMVGNNLTLHYVARNAADSAAYRARSNATIPATIFGIGLGGTSQAPPGYAFMMRVTNDPSADTYSPSYFANPSVPLYSDCSTEATCQHWTNQPVGMFRYAPNPTILQDMFVQMASQILRLSQ